MVIIKEMPKHWQKPEDEMGRLKMSLQSIFGMVICIISWLLMPVEAF